MTDKSIEVMISTQPTVQVGTVGLAMLRALQTKQNKKKGTGK